ncbi:MAG: hypothetical protein DWQ37_20300 [Planctomycetota bacterium]|nr:MAG: hypothetical protein DWQ37_20300 [Planctomycetota bacterium]
MSQRRNRSIASRLATSSLAGEVLEDRQLLSGDGLLAEPLAEVSPATEADPLYSSATPGGYTPAQMRHAYGFDQIFFDGAIEGDGTGQTIAIVNAYHTPTAAADLAAFSTYFGLPQVNNFVQVDQYGYTNYTSSSAGWARETALDIQWAHAFAPGADILLVEANSASFSDLFAAVDYARNYEGVSVVSLSWGANEFASEANYDSFLTTPPGHEPVSFFASAGNSGGPGVYPAYSPNVVAVGGTTLTLDGAGNILNEVAWSGSGGGISQYELQPPWQAGVVTQTDTFRAMPDVAFEADPNTGVPVYDTYNNPVGAPWSKVAGTSFAAPAWASLVAIANQGRTLAGLPVFGTADLLTELYTMPASNFNDITSGTSTQGTIPQTAGPGYDLVTGRGTPKAQLIVADLVGVSSMPGNVSLVAASDTGISSADGITRLNNGSGGSVLQFEVTGTIAGATVTILADGTPIGSAIAAGTTTIVTTDGLLALADGAHNITATQTESGLAPSSSSPALSITVDATAPVSSIVAVAPDPRTTPVDAITINFNEAVSGLDLSGLTLTRDGGSNLLTLAQSIAPINSQTWTLGNLTSLTTAVGLYELDLLAALSPVMDAAGNIATNADTSFTVSSVVLGRALFYNQSSFDGNDAGINASDDAAIATDKLALLPDAGAATFANISSYRRGINGVMLDLSGTHPNLSASDFSFRVGNNNTPAAWALAPEPLAVSVRPGAGVDGSDRVEIIWADGAIANTWLQVIVAANGNTGLAVEDEFFFGNRIGESGSGTATLAVTNAVDEIGARNNTGIGAGITNVYDFDRNGLVNAVDSITARNNVGTLAKIDIITPPPAPFATAAAEPAAEPADEPAPAPLAIEVADEEPEVVAEPATATFDAGVAFAIAAEHWQQMSAGGAWFESIDDALLDLLAGGSRHAARRRR